MCRLFVSGDQSIGGFVRHMHDYYENREETNDYIHTAKALYCYYFAEFFDECELHLGEHVGKADIEFGTAKVILERIGEGS